MILQGGVSLHPYFLTIPSRTDRESLADYVSAGGYSHMSAVTGDGILAAVEAAGLRGRGGSGRGHPVGERWQEVRAGAPGMRYVVANGAETSPGSRKDRLLMERYPHRVLEGAVAAARVVGAGKVWFYVKATAGEAVASMEQAVAELAESGLLADLPDIETFRAPDSGVAGEESAVCDAIEGFEGRPQVKPPTPASMGILGRPTLVANVETLAAVAAVLREGPAAGSTALFTLSGDVQWPGVYELPIGTPLRALIEECGGGATGAIVAVLPGGYRSGPLVPHELDLPLAYDAMAGAGTTLGSAHVVVLAQPGTLAQLMAGALELAAIGSCKQCAICAEGTARLHELAICLACSEDAQPLREAMGEWAALLHGKGNCKLPTGVAAMVRRALSRFEYWREEGTLVGSDH
jgi:NADH-quinone oxidoreductase subunit F